MPRPPFLQTLQKLVDNDAGHQPSRSSALSVANYKLSTSTTSLSDHLRQELGITEFPDLCFDNSVFNG
jgi:hypothetical protein